MKNKSKNKTTIGDVIATGSSFVLAVSLALGVGGTIGYWGAEGIMSLIGNNISTSQRKTFGDVCEYLGQTSNGAYTTLPLTKNPIQIAIQQFDDSDRELIKQAVQKLDNISTNLNYTILSKDASASKADISFAIYNGDEQTSVLGNTKFDSNGFDGKIKYPISITINKDLIQSTASIFKHNYNECFDYVIKHELLHTLGFKDLYEEKYKYTTLAYGWHGYSSTHIEGYYDVDVKNIQKLYDEGLIKVEYPKYVQIPTTYVQDSIKEKEVEDELLTF